MSAVVVGYGIKDGLGSNIYECVDNLLDDSDHHQQVDYLNDCKTNTVIRASDVFEFYNYITEKQEASLTRSQKLALHAVSQALIHSRIRRTCDSKNVAVVVCSNSNEREGMEEIFTPLMANKRVSPSKILNNQADSIATLISSTFGFTGPAIAVQAACVGGLAAIDIAMRFVFDHDYVIVVGADASTSPLSVKALTALHATSNKSMPFDDNRNGLVMGDGGGCLILQSASNAAKYRMSPYAKLYKAFSYTDNYNPTSPDPDCVGAMYVMDQATRQVGKIPDAVSAHATSTIVGDKIEYTAISKLFNSKVPVYAPKSKIGHTHGAAGIVETIYAIETMRRHTIPHIANLNSCSFDTENILVGKNTSMRGGTLHTLNNSFGFGGRCMAQMIEVSPFV